MKLPNCESAVVPEAKITDYLLSLTHRDGRSKARFFIRFGFSLSSWEDLSAALLEHAALHEVAKIEDSPFGKRYVIEGELYTPDRRNPTIRSVWFIKTGVQNPYFVTAYPLERKEK